MRWKAYIYGSILLWIILLIFASVMMGRQDTLSFPTLWKVLSEFACTFILLTVGLGMALDHRNLLAWLGDHLNWHPPTLNARIFGWFVFLLSLLLLTLSIMDLSIVLGILPNLYAPDSAVWFLRREVGPLSWTLRARRSLHREG